MSINYLILFRNNRYISQKEIAKVLGISLSYYQKVEGGFATPGYGLLKKISKEFKDFDFNELFK